MDRKYVAVSIKHTEHKWRFGKSCVLWGYRHTSDDEPRCFSGYTSYLKYAERYSIGDFKKKGYGGIVKDNKPVPMSADLCSKWRGYDSVLVDAEEYYNYCKMSGLAVEPLEDWNKEEKKDA